MKNTELSKYCAHFSRRFSILSYRFCVHCSYLVDVMQCVCLLMEIHTHPFRYCHDYPSYKRMWEKPEHEWVTGNGRSRKHTHIMKCVYASLYYTNTRLKPNQFTVYACVRAFSSSQIFIDYIRFNISCMFSKISHQFDKCIRLNVPHTHTTMSCSIGFV